MLRRNHLWLHLAVLIVVAACGCDGRRGVVPVEGRITFGGSPPPSPGYVYFTPVDMQAGETGSEPRPGTALFMHDGGFRPTTFTAGDGLRPGEYDVRVECHLPSDARGGHGVGKSAVPGDFQPPRVKVAADGPVPVAVTIDVP